VIAARLSEAPDVSVLLLEAGRRDTHPFMPMPIAFPKVASHRSYIWPFESEPEPGLNRRRLPIWRGKTLGGCSSINAMINMRGNPLDFDLWREQGLAGWGYADVLPYFKRLETSWRGAGKYHGADGPVGNTLVDYPDSLFSQLRQAAKNMGLPYREDQHAEPQEGISRVELTTANGRRSSTARTYLRPAMSRPNLTILTRAHVTRVVLDGARATGVEYLHSGTLHRVQARRETVLSGGAYNSPQLLLLSGIGPADHLQSIGIPVAHDLPGVGENLLEHPNMLNIYQVRGNAGFTRHLRADRATLAVMKWFLRGDGPFVTAGAVGNIFLHSREGLQRPDVQIVDLPVHQHGQLWFPALTKRPTYALTARVGVLHMKSRGWVRLRSADPLAHPRILFNMFTEDGDLDTMVRAVKLSRELHRQNPLSDLVEKELLPGENFRTDAELAVAIRQTTEHRHHPLGTCRMGVDGKAVVDAQLRVHGIDNLRIADASIMPDDPTGNTNVPTIMIGEKAADLIRNRTLAPAQL
jgi:choline dehydrogenase